MHSDCCNKKKYSYILSALEPSISGLIKTQKYLERALILNINKRKNSNEKKKLATEKKLKGSILIWPALHQNIF